MPRNDDRDTAATDTAEASGGAPSARAGSSVSLSDLPVAGLTRRRIGILMGALIGAWVILLFAHQVGQASEASAKADAMRSANAELQANVEALQSELALIQRQDYVEQQARAYRLGGAHEIPFALADNAPPLPADAPGSALVRLGAASEQPSPIEQWIRLLFGPGGDPSDPASRSGS
ncbi:MAG: septum formation initiator family protein [Chloroflexota bacterium]